MPPTSGIIESLPWLRLSPPVIAILLAILFKDVNFALILATFAGCVLLTDLSVLNGITVACDIFVKQIADPDHASVILFTVLLGAMIGLMNDSGGTSAVISRMSRFANSRKRGQVLTWAAGLVIFFDDYANTMLIGGSMRPLSDKLKISRAKLAFLIDATAAPVAGLLLSTWTAFEIDQVKAGLEAANVTAEAGSVFIATIPFRIYPILAIGMVAAIAFSGKDFGPMLRAENAVERDASAATSLGEQQTGSVWFAIFPITALVTVIFASVGAEVFQRGINAVLATGLQTDSYRLLLLASVAASTVAAACPIFSGKMSFAKSSESWTNGISSMIPAVIVLILAWSISAVCGKDQLGTAQYIISLIGNALSPEFLPAVAFIAAGAIALSIGSSFTTMSLLIPLFIPLTWSIVSKTQPDLTAHHPIFLATLGAILAGAIFGDHCSPISDTTVLSSAAAGCNHLQHVSTQLPYALVIAGSSLFLGYLPIGFGIPWWIALPVSAMACIAVVLFFGREPTYPATDNESQQIKETS